MILLAGIESPFRDTLVQGLRQCLPALRIVELDNMAEAIECLSKSNEIELAVADVGLMDDNTIGSLRRLLPKKPGLRFIVAGSQPCRPEVVRVLEAGAVAYMPASLSTAEVANAIDLVNAGVVFAPLPSEAPLSHNNSHCSRSRFVLPQRRAAAPNNLTPRLRTVLGYLAQGASNREIAERLGIAEGTVKVHVSAIIKQFGVSSRDEAVRRSAELNIEPRSL